MQLSARPAVLRCKFIRVQYEITGNMTPLHRAAERKAKLEIQFYNKDTRERQTKQSSNEIVLIESQLEVIAMDICDSLTFCSLSSWSGSDFVVIESKKSHSLHILHADSKCY